MAERKLIRIQEKGQVTPPAEVRRQPGFKKGDLVAGTVTDEGVLITPQEVLAVLEIKALDRIGEALRSRGLSSEELVQSGREIRGQILREKYGIVPDDDQLDVS